jgi:hypothetical protein
VIIPELGSSVNPFSDLVALVKVYRLIKGGRYHIVHTHSSKAGVLGRLAAKAAGTPIVVHTLHSLVFHDYQPGWLNHLLRLVKRALAPLTDHYISVSDHRRESARGRNRRAVPVFDRLQRHGTRLVPRRSAGSASRSC